MGCREMCRCCLIPESGRRSYQGFAGDLSGFYRRCIGYLPGGADQLEHGCVGLHGPAAIWLCAFIAKKELVMTGKDVWVTVCGSSDAEEAPVREYAAGVWQRIGSTDCVRYSQKAEGSPDTAVLLRIEADRLCVTRRGAVESAMVFRTGERHSCRMKTPAGLLEFDVATNALKIKKAGTDRGEHENGVLSVCIRAEYDLEAQGRTISAHILEMEIEEKRSAGVDRTGNRQDLAFHGKE